MLNRDSKCSCKNAPEDEGGSNIADNTEFAQRVVGAGGEVILASVGGEKEVALDFFGNQDGFRFEAIGKPDELLFRECGHRGPKKFRIYMWSGGVDYAVPARQVRGIFHKYVNGMLCPECFFKLLEMHSIRCALCGGEITPGDGVALYGKESAAVRLEAATFVGDAVVGCLRWNCCPSAGFLSGSWTEKGFQQADFGKNNIAPK